MQAFVWQSVPTPNYGHLCLSHVWLNWETPDIAGLLWRSVQTAQNATIDRKFVSRIPCGDLSDVGFKSANRSLSFIPTPVVDSPVH